MSASLKDIINKKLQKTCLRGKNHIVGVVLTHGCASEKRYVLFKQCNRMDFDETYSGELSTNIYNCSVD